MLDIDFKNALLSLESDTVREVVQEFMLSLLLWTSWCSEEAEQILGARWAA